MLVIKQRCKSCKVSEKLPFSEAGQGWASRMRDGKQGPANQLTGDANNAACGQTMPLRK